ncbi:hypothetical protein VCR15J2_20382 [Vibrio coralliirubri]|nr:hypothetical protein VCR15J2_20382 [Vibrio coralliirubri]
MSSFYGEYCYVDECDFCVMRGCFGVDVSCAKQTIEKRAPFGALNLLLITVL